MSKALKRKKKLQQRKKNQDNFIDSLRSFNREGEARAKRAIIWMRENNTSQLPKDFA